jgi:hypothetical protein
MTEAQTGFEQARSQPVRALFASSTEGRTVARDLRSLLPHEVESTLWDESVIRPGRAAWADLIEICRRVDFAVLVLTPDDEVTLRGEQVAAPRDNVIFEAGLFMGLLGPERALLVQRLDVDLRLPTDLDGITRVRYPGPLHEADVRGSLDIAAREIERCIARLGRRDDEAPPSGDDRRALDDEVDMLCRAATARGWTVVTRTTSALCLRYTGGRPVELRVNLADAKSARHELRNTAHVLHKLGVRVARALLPPPEKSR